MLFRILTNDMVESGGIVIQNIQILVRFRCALYIFGRWHFSSQECQCITKSMQHSIAFSTTTESVAKTIHDMCMREIEKTVDQERISLALTQNPSEISSRLSFSLSQLNEMFSP